MRGQLLVCPPVDRHMDTPAWRDLGDDFVPRRSQMAWMWDLYFGAENEHISTGSDPFTAGLAGMPPAVIVVAEYDPLRDEALTLAERFRAAGVAAEVIDCAGQIHPVISHAPNVAACAAYLKQASAAVASLLQSDTTLR